jgi:hypothetical protein
MWRADTARRSATSTPMRCFICGRRGIPEAEAKSLLIHAFLADAMEGFGDDGIRQTLTERLDAALVSIGQASHERRIRDSPVCRI